PSIEDAEKALKDLEEVLEPSRPNGCPGHKHACHNPYVYKRLIGMRALLYHYTLPTSSQHGKWQAASLEAATSMGRSTYGARVLRRMVRQYILDRSVLPFNPFGKWKVSMLHDEDLLSAVTIHLQSLGTEISAHKLMKFLHRPDVREEFSIGQAVSERTCGRYLRSLGYRRQYASKGQYVDGHERSDVVHYRQIVYIPALGIYAPRAATYSWAGNINLPQLEPGQKHVIIWYHDESIFYAHDRKHKMWVHKDAGAQPYQKGEGLSLMVANFVSADFGWLAAPDGRTAQQVFRPGKNRDGYFDNNDVISQALDAAALVHELWPDYEHVFIYDNAPSHQKRYPNALSASDMPKFSSFWYPPQYQNIDGKRKKINSNLRMEDTEWNGQVQHLYYPDDHPDKAGQCKGMAQILIERGYEPHRFHRTKGLKAECPGFRCPDDGLSECCTRRILYNQPDFSSVPSVLERKLADEGIKVIYLPKFHCELNPIEQCWGYAKRLYRLCPESSKEEDLRTNALASLDAVPLESIRRFFNRSARFTHAYEKGLTGSQAAWAAKKYRGHRVLPDRIMHELEKAEIT
ncbi:hypothetical protein DL93DRAFT_2043508, partial [Clavulina sp. PMI_390]